MLFDSLKDIGSMLKYKIDDINISSKSVLEIKDIKTKIHVTEKEIESAYMAYGKGKYEGKTDEELAHIKSAIDSKIAQKRKLQDQINIIQKELDEKRMLKELNGLEITLNEELEKYQNALEMGILTEEEYRKEVVRIKRIKSNFQEIRRIEAKYEKGLISESQRNSLLEELMQ